MTNDIQNNCYPYFIFIYINIPKLVWVKNELMNNRGGGEVGNIYNVYVSHMKYQHIPTYEVLRRLI